MAVDCPVLGVRLTFTTTEAGGRRTALPGGSSVDVRMQYRPNWGLPGWPDGDQTGAPVLGFSTSDISPGETADAVIVPMFADQVPEWWEVATGDELRMYGGSRVCGVAIVQWVDKTEFPPSREEAERLLARSTERRR